MCWSLEVTFGFFLADACFLLFLLFMVDVRFPLMRIVNVHDCFDVRWLCYVMFVGFYTIMEFLQLVQWVTLTYPITNALLTYVAYILIWAQPVMFSIIAMIPHYRTIPRDLKILFWMSVFTFVYAMTSIMWGGESGRDVTKVCLASLNTNYAMETHTTIGPNGHLLWLFDVMTLQYQPTHYVYMLLIVTTLLNTRDTILKSVLSFGWGVTFLVSVSLIGSGPELPSFWCFLSVFANVPILMDVLRSRGVRV